MKKKLKSINTPISSFVLKLSELLDDERLRNIVNWNTEGDAFKIDSHSQLMEGILAQHFNHRKISSFVRQLNMYGFKKVSEKGSQMIYKHPNFIREKTCLQNLIKRKVKIEQKQVQVEVICVKKLAPTLQRQKNKANKLQEIYIRIKIENQKLDNQALVLKDCMGMLTQIKASSFYLELQAQNASLSADNNPNNVSGKQSLAIVPLIMRGESNTAETQGNRKSQEFQEQNDEQSFMQETSFQNPWHGEQNNQNSDIQILQQDHSGPYLNKTNGSQQKPNNFWDQNKYSLD